MEALKAEGVCHSYGKGGGHCEVLRDFSLTMSEGEFVALMGPSGSGKSTFLHLAAGLLVPTAGEILVGGVSITSMGDAEATRFRRRHEGIIFQSFNLIDTLSVADNISLSSRFDRAGVDSSRVSELVEKLGLSGKERRRPGELSGGEQQRVAIARALYAKPDVILADEPTGNLDARTAHSICAVLKDLNVSERCAILLVTHDPVVASVATRVCFLKEGAVSCDFPTDHDPATISRRYLEMYE